jgi:hypothetical protein
MLTPYEYSCICKGFSAKRLEDYKLARMQAYWSYASCFVNSKDKPKTMQQFWPLESDKQDAKKERFTFTKEQVEEIFKRHNIKPKHNGNNS